MSETRAGLTYADAGVDIDKADKLIDRIKGLAASTKRAGVLDGIGGFASLFSLTTAIEALGGMEDPVLVSGTDGVGTKLKIAFETGRHDTVGIDLVAMCINDILTTGATPLFFLDYFATGRLEIDCAHAVISGITEGCKRAEAALVGGETAELPGLYKDGEYDLAGFAVGVVDRAKLIDGSAAKVGDAILGLRSTGIHSNGLSLARKALLEVGGLSLDTPLIEGGETLVQDALLEPTAIYTKAIKALRAEVEVKAMAHITGGGIPGNLPRVLPKKLGAVIDPERIQPHPIFERIATLGGVEETEMYKTFNMGLGLCVVVEQASAEEALGALTDAGQPASIVGRCAELDGASRVTFSSKALGS